MLRMDPIKLPNCLQWLTGLIQYMSVTFCYHQMPTGHLKQHVRQADSLIKLIKSGTSFEALAQANSDDQGSAQIGGDLGWFTEGRMVLPFNDACFSGKKGDIKTAETTFGIHIIEILGQSKNSQEIQYWNYRQENYFPVRRQIRKHIVKPASLQAQTIHMRNLPRQLLNRDLNKRVANDIAPQQKTLPGLD